MRFAPFIAALLGMALAGMMSGCAYPQHQSVSEPGMPEEIYTTPLGAASTLPRFCVLGFSSPAAAPDTGRFAALLLHRELLKQGFSSEIRPEILSRPPSSDRSTSDHSDMEACDQIVTGDVLHYFEGGLLSPSRVDQQVRVLDIREPFARILWEARAAEVSAPLPYGDWILLQTAGAAALPAAELMRRNAEKFANMISEAVIEPFSPAGQGDPAP